MPPEAEPARDFIEVLVARYEKRIDELEKRVASLTAQVQKLTPRNSSLPPSSEHPHAKPQPPLRPGNKRKQGGQKGHKRHLRALVPSEQCRSVMACYPAGCRRCGGRLRPDATEPKRHQVWDLPPIQPAIDEYQLFRGHCPGCGITTRAELPPGVPGGQCGPRLAAFTGLLMGHFRQSKRRASAFLGDLLNIPCSPAWTVKIQNLVSGAVAAPYEELRSKLTQQKQLYVDESPTKESKQKAWLWVAVAPAFAVFGVFGNRSRESLVSLVGDYSGIILNCDRAKMYLDGKRLQWCWAHLKRDIQNLIDSPNGQVKHLGRDLMREHVRLFKLWNRYKAGKIKWRAFQADAAPIRDSVNGLVLRGSYSGNKQLVGFCDGLLPRKEHLWTSLEVEGVEPTNNTAERALRPAVIYRKLSFGTQSASGSRYLERMLSVSETCRLQNRSAYEYLVEAMQAHFARRTAPSLLTAKSANAYAAA
ncbi:IS66 family transposase [Pirellulimonas nuda]|uniref:IS66 family transposase n=1 Tax=Pirellulimonas nuda TaxID=2528009 RepID=UPI0018D4CCD2|nr:IS66 family transposase [Pirellulimonas nuda]